MEEGTVFYNWRKIYKEVNGSCSKIVDIIFYLTYKNPPKTKRDPTYWISQRNWKGSSFLLRPKKLLGKRERYGNKIIADYIGVASLRNYAEYATRGKNYVDADLLKGKEDIISVNPLLTLEDNKVYLKFD